MSAHGDFDNRRDLTDFSALVDECRNLAVRHLSILCTGIYDSAGQALLDFADKAENNAMQSNFFEAIQEIDRGRQNIKRIFESEIRKGFAQLLHVAPDFNASDTRTVGRASTRTSATGFDLGGLQLLDKLAHAESVVVQSLAAKSNSRYLEQLYALGQRLAIINRGRKLEESALPTGPSHILNAFSTSVQDLRIQPNVKLVLFALFDRVVMKQLAPLYEDLNLSLMKNGILPNLRPSVRKGQHAKSDASPTMQVRVEPTALTSRPGGAAKGAAGGSVNAAVQAEGDSVGSMGDQLFSTLCELLATRRRVEQAANPQPSSPEDLIPVAPYTDNVELVTAITRIQGEHTALDAFIESATPQGERVDKEQLAVIRSNLEEQRKRIYEGVDRRRVPQVEIDVIDVVGMLFDCVLDDEMLPNCVKALLSRLHTPYLKIAVLDKQLFSSDRHPARQLLNAMADAGTRWVSQDRLDAGIFPQMEYTVNMVLQEFQDGLQLFEELLEEFSSSVDALQKKAAIIEARALEAAKGHEMLHRARQRAQHEVADRSDGQQLPPLASKFLAEIWADHLMLILLRSRGGDRSQEWTDALSITDEIVWSVTPKTTAEEREHLAVRLPELQRIIEDDLGSLGGYGKHQQEDLYGLLKELQKQALQPPVEVKAGTAVADQSSEAGSPGGIMTSPAAAEQVESQPEIIPPGEQTLIDALRTVKFGTLFDFTINEQGDMRRLKLSWYSQVTSNYMFVDQLGVKVAVYTVRELAGALLEGKAIWVKERNKPFFEWALDAVRNILSGSINATTH